MTEDKGILIRNIYIMLSYAFQELKHNNYEYIKNQNFDNILDLLAEILYKGISKQLKQGLHKEYLFCNESLASIRGKIDLKETFRNQINRKRYIGCEFDELSENNIFNRILKTTAFILINNKALHKTRKQQIRKIMPYFSNVDIIQPETIRWQSLIYRKDNTNYEMLMNICYFIIDSLLLTTETGNYKVETFTDKYMPKLFEHFVLEYYKRHTPMFKAHADQIPWNISEFDKSVTRFLPNMKSDITLHCPNKTIIIDTKYYSKALIRNMNKNEIRSAHLYQIYSYVKNLDVKHNGDVSGILLYAKTDEDISPNLNAIFDKNKISVHTLDLNCEFCEIAEQLDNLIK